MDIILSQIFRLRILTTQNLIKAARLKYYFLKLKKRKKYSIPRKKGIILPRMFVKKLKLFFHGINGGKIKRLFMKVDLSFLSKLDHS